MNIIHTLFPQCAARPGPRPAWERPGAAWSALEAPEGAFLAISGPGAPRRGRCERGLEGGTEMLSRREKSRPA